ncbi:cell wall-binding repeat-containing protein [Desulfosporosinus sp. SB140]|uniref:cell wall-binding repeat-containing protein n=1 Tax=Desulfosporosinus paludis TaxID=3115649 RepID=UPI0038904CA1
MVKRLGILLLIISLSFAFSPPLISKADVSANSTFRMAGNDRYQTAVEVSKNGWPTGSNSLILAYGENFPDALSAASLAKKMSAPILLTPRNELDSNTANEIIRLGTKQVYIVGGTGVVSGNVADKLISMGITVERIAGYDRFETSVCVAQKLGSCSEAFIVTGEDFPDALSVAPIAAKKGIPILLVAKDYLPDSVKNYLSEKNIAKTYVVGGSDIIDSNVVAQLPNPEIINGSDRYDRNVNIINKFSSDIDFSNVYLATGENFPDALAGAALAPNTSSPIILIITTPSYGTNKLIFDKSSLIKSIRVLGGTAVVTDKTLSDLGSDPDKASNVVDNSTGNINYDQWIINQATLRILAKQAEEKRKEWDSYTTDQKYNRTYKQYVDKLADYNKEFNILKGMADDKPDKIISDQADVLKDKISNTSSEISDITPIENSGDSKLYLQKSCEALKSVVEKVNWYSFYKSINDVTQINEATKELNDAVTTFNEDFSKSYNYSIITENNGFNATEINQANTELYKFLTEYTTKFEKAYDNLKTAYDSMKNGKAQIDLMKVAKENICKPGYFDSFTSGKEEVSKIMDTYNCGTEAYKTLEQYSYDVITGDNGSDGNAAEKLSAFKTKVDELKSDLTKMEANNTAIQSVVDHSVQDAKEAELEFLEDKGFSSMEEYQKALEEQEKSTTAKQIADEAENISAEMKKQEEEKKLLLKLPINDG